MLIRRGSGGIFFLAQKVVPDPEEVTCLARVSDGRIHDLRVDRVERGFCADLRGGSNRALDLLMTPKIGNRQHSANNRAQHRAGSD
ncbi:MAG TPA: hypothetical protein VJZ00_23365, partial [Thermoanaerobaculia bacterium]|nr:hypothetical protein [Thermoanaerobaculia bacterium]